MPDGTVVTATVDGLELEVTSVFSSAEGSSFRIDVPGDVPETPGDEGGVEGEAVVFRIGNSEVPENGVWRFGSHQRVGLSAAIGPDLSITQDDGRATTGVLGTCTDGRAPTTLEVTELSSAFPGLASGDF